MCQRRVHTYITSDSEGDTLYQGTDKSEAVHVALLNAARIDAFDNWGATKWCESEYNEINTELADANDYMNEFAVKTWFP